MDEYSKAGQDALGQLAGCGGCDQTVGCLMLGAGAVALLSGLVGLASKAEQAAQQAAPAVQQTVPDAHLSPGVLVVLGLLIWIVWWQIRDGQPWQGSR